MTDRAQDTEAIRAALEYRPLAYQDMRLKADAALARLVARLEAAEQALADFANPQHWAIDRSPIYAHPKCVWIGTYEVSPVDHACAALAAAAPGETTPVGKPPLDVAGILWVAAIDRVPLGERTDWVKATEKRVAAINEARAAPGETEQTP